MPEVPLYTVWMKESEAAHAWERRNAYLQAVDTAVMAYHANGKKPTDVAAIRSALEAYIADHIKRNGKTDSWKTSVRNRTRAVENLRSAVAEKVTVPTVVGPPLPPPPPPAPVPPSKPANPAVAKLLTKVNEELRKEFDHMARTPTAAVVNPHQTTLETRLEALANDLLKLKLDIVQANERTRSNFLEGLNNGFKQFESLHTQDAEDLEFKLSVASAACDALAALPFPFSVVGQAGKAAVGSLKVQKFSATRDYLGVKMPEPHGLWATAAEASAKLEDLRTINVAPSKLGQNMPATRAAFEKAFKDYEQAFKTNWDKETESLSDRTKRRKLAEAMVSGFSKVSTDAQMRMQVVQLTREIDRLGKQVEGRFDDHTDLYHVDLKKVGVWVTVWLIADYALSGVCQLKEGKTVATIPGPTLGSKRFGQKFAEFLASDDVGIIELKDGSEKSAAIYAKGKIPWSGHPTHVVGVMLYLEYVQKHLNPFRLFERTVKPAMFEDRSRTYIKALGAAMSTHKVSHRFSHDTVDDVAGLAASLRPSP